MQCCKSNRRDSFPSYAKCLYVYENGPSYCNAGQTVGHILDRNMAWHQSNQVKVKMLKLVDIEKNKDEIKIQNVHEFVDDDSNVRWSGN